MEVWLQSLTSTIWWRNPKPLTSSLTGHQAAAGPGEDGGAGLPRPHLLPPLLCGLGEPTLPPSWQVWAPGSPFDPTYMVGPTNSSLAAEVEQVEEELVKGGEGEGRSKVAVILLLVGMISFR